MHLRFLIPLCAFVLVASPALAAPAWKKELGPSKPGSHAALPPGKLVFNLSWKDIVNSARLEFDIGKPGAHKPGVTVIGTTPAHTPPQLAMWTPSAVLAWESQMSR